MWPQGRWAEVSGLAGGDSGALCPACGLPVTSTWRPRKVCRRTKKARRRMSKSRQMRKAARSTQGIVSEGSNQRGAAAGSLGIVGGASPRRPKGIFRSRWDEINDFSTPLSPNSYLMRA